VRSGAEDHQACNGRATGCKEHGATHTTPGEPYEWTPLGTSETYVLDFDNKHWQPAHVAMISAVPEPTALALMFAGVGLMLARLSLAARPT
jgi:hypothetical protein